MNLSYSTANPLEPHSLKLHSDQLSRFWPAWGRYTHRGLCSELTCVFLMFLVLGLLWMQSLEPVGIISGVTLVRTERAGNLTTRDKCRWTNTSPYLPQVDSSEKHFIWLLRRSEGRLNSVSTACDQLDRHPGVFFLFCFFFFLFSSFHHSILHKSVYSK